MFLYCQNVLAPQVNKPAQHLDEERLTKGEKGEKKDESSDRVWLFFDRVRRSPGL